MSNPALELHFKDSSATFESFEYGEPVRGKDFSQQPDEGAGLALLLLLVEYFVWGVSERRGRFVFSGSVDDSAVASLCNAIEKKENWLNRLFQEPKADVPSIKNVLKNVRNRSGKNKTQPRSITVNTDLIPPAHFKIFWDGKPITLERANLLHRALLKKSKWKNRHTFKFPCPVSMRSVPVLAEVQPDPGFSFLQQEGIRNTPRLTALLSYEDLIFKTSDIGFTSEHLPPLPSQLYGFEPIKISSLPTTGCVGVYGDRGSGISTAVNVLARCWMKKRGYRAFWIDCRRVGRSEDAYIQVFGDAYFKKSNQLNPERSALDCLKQDKTLVVFDGMEHRHTTSLTAVIDRISKSSVAVLTMGFRRSPPQLRTDTNIRGEDHSLLSIDASHAFLQTELSFALEGPEPVSRMALNEVILWMADFCDGNPLNLCLAKSLIKRVGDKAFGDKFRLSLEFLNDSTPGEKAAFRKTHALLQALYAKLQGDEKDVLDQLAIPIGGVPVEVGHLIDPSARVLAQLIEVGLISNWRGWFQIHGLLRDLLISTMTEQHYNGQRRRAEWSMDFAIIRGLEVDARLLMPRRFRDGDGPWSR